MTRIHMRRTFVGIITSLTVAIMPAQATASSPRAWAGWNQPNARTATGTLTVPSLSATDNQGIASYWVGLQALSGGGLVQVGITQMPDPATGTYVTSAWWASCPNYGYPGTQCEDNTIVPTSCPSALPPTYSQPCMYPGDVVTLGVAPVAGGYRVSVWDQTTHSAIWTHVPYPRMPVTEAQWVVEAQPDVYLANFGNLTFRDVFPLTAGRIRFSPYGIGACMLASSAWPRWHVATITWHGYVCS